ncbi:hypothetical protein Aduo_005188 [Ancylostoma duodenale]
MKPESKTTKSLSGVSQSPQRKIDKTLLFPLIISQQWNFLERGPYRAARSRKKAPPFAEREITALVKLYCVAREEFSRKFEGEFSFQPAKRITDRKITSLGVCERSEKQIEERLRADLKRVSKYAVDMRKKYTGTGEGEGPQVRSLPHYLMPLYEATRQKPNVTGLAAILKECEEYNEQPTSSKAILKVKVEPKTPPRQPSHEVKEPRSMKSPSPLLLEEQQETRESAKPPEKT